MTTFIAKPYQQDGFDLARANRQKFLLRQMLEQRIKELLKQTSQQACQQFLFAEDFEQRVSVSDAYQFKFNPGLIRCSPKF